MRRANVPIRLAREGRQASTAVFRQLVFFALFENGRIRGGFKLLYRLSFPRMSLVSVRSLVPRLQDWSLAGSARLRRPQLVAKALLGHEATLELTHNNKIG